MKRSTIASITALVLVSEVLFPPFNSPVRWDGGQFIGFGFLFSQPEFKSGISTYYGSVHVELLAIELVVTFVVGWLFIRFVAKE